MVASDYEKILNDIISQDDCGVILINGPWGIGKTYFWKEFSAKINDNKPENKQEKIAYISLFGKNDISEIRSEALLQIFGANKFVDNTNKLLAKLGPFFSIAEKFAGGGLSFTGNAIGSLLSLFNKKELNDCIVCFDDFERKSDTLNIKEIMGFASILSEQHGCKVVLIMDEGKVTQGSERKIYEDYKEKIVSFEIKFNPSQSEIVSNLIATVCGKYKNGVIDAVKDANITNLRTIKKVKLLLNILDKHLNKEYNDDFNHTIGYKISFLSVAYFEYGKDSLVDSSRFGLSKDTHENSNEIVQLNERLHHRVSIYSELDKLLWNFIASLEPDINSLNIEFTKITKNAEKLKLNDFIINVIDLYTFDAHYSNANFVNEIKNKLEENKHDLLEFISLNNFKYIIDCLSKVSDNPDFFSNFYNTVLINYVNSRLDAAASFDDLKNIKQSDIISAIISTNETAREQLEQKISQLEGKLMNIEIINDLINLIQEEHGWTPDDEKALNAVPVELIKKGILCNPIFFKNLYKFVQWSNRFQTRPFLQFYLSIERALNELGDSELGSYRYSRVVDLLGFAKNTNSGVTN